MGLTANPTRTVQEQEPQQSLQQAFFPGNFVMLQSTKSQHPDAGRIGRIVCQQGINLLVEFFIDDRIKHTLICVLPTKNWALIPEPFVECYELRSKKIGWRLSEKGQVMAQQLGWETTLASEGKN
jgi:hypothetical protein